MKKGLKIKALFLNKEIRDMDLMGLDYNYSNCDQQEVILYNIDAITSEFDDSGEYTAIVSGFKDFVVPYKIGEVEKMVNDYYLESF